MGLMVCSVPALQTYSWNKLSTILMRLWVKFLFFVDSLAATTACEASSWVDGLFWYLALFSYYWNKFSSVMMHLWVKDFVLMDLFAAMTCFFGFASTIFGFASTSVGLYGQNKNKNPFQTTSI